MTFDCSLLADGIKLTIQIFSVICGWVVVHYLSKARDLDKVRGELLIKATDTIGDEVLKLFDIARDYHTTIRSTNKEISIKMTLQDISMRTHYLKDISKYQREIKSCSKAVLLLKKSITESHFEDEHDGSLSSDARQLQDIAAAVLNVKRHFMALKHTQFSAK